MAVSNPSSSSSEKSSSETSIGTNGISAVAAGISAKTSKNLALIRGVGYCLLLLSSIDALYVLFPPEFTNPVWEYQTIGDLVKLIPVLLLAFMLAFYGETATRSKEERQILRLLSWSTLVISLVFLLLIPLIASDTMRISQYNNNKISDQVNQQKLQLDTTRQQLEQATPEQLQSLVPVPDAKGQLPDAPSTPEQAKAQVLANLEKAQIQADAQAKQARSNLRQNLMKNTAKLIAQSFIGGFIFMYIWSMTRWARQLKSYGYEASSTLPMGSLATLIQKIPQPLQRKTRRRRSV